MSKKGYTSKEILKWNKSDAARASRSANRGYKRRKWDCPTFFACYEAGYLAGLKAKQ